VFVPREPDPVSVPRIDLRQHRLGGRAQPYLAENAEDIDVDIALPAPEEIGGQPKKVGVVGELEFIKDASVFLEQPAD
jgi:hypothetical protein